MEELSDDNTQYYPWLGLARDAPQDNVGAAYREAAKNTHPDVGGDPMRFYEVNKAYAVLRTRRSARSTTSTVSAGWRRCERR